MNLEDRLSYCKICTNQKFNVEKGILCSLTDKKPDFFPSCLDFNEDKSARKRMEMDILYKHMNYIEYSAIENYRLEYRYPTNKKRIDKLDKTLPDTLNLRIPSIGLLLIFLLILLSLIVSIINPNCVSVPFNYLISGMIVFLLVSTAFLFFRRWKTGFAFAIVDAKGIKLRRNQFLKWESILCVMLKSEQLPKDKSLFPKYYLCFWRLGSAKPDAVEIDFFPFYMSWILTAIEVYRMRNNKQNPY